MLVNNSSDIITWYFGIEECRDLFEKDVFRFAFKETSKCGIDQNYERKTMQSGETFELGIIFSPGKVFMLQCFWQWVSYSNVYIVDKVLIDYSLVTESNFFLLLTSKKNLPVKSFKVNKQMHCISFY